MKKLLIIGGGALVLILVPTFLFLRLHLHGSIPCPENLIPQRTEYASRPQPEEPVLRNISYTGNGFAQKTLDIYMPLPEEDAEYACDSFPSIPAIVYIHGGFWRHGSKEDIRVHDHLLREWRTQGWAVISIDYECSPFRRLDGPERQVQKALRWVRAHASDYGLDKWNLGIFSVSTGSQLAMTAMIAAGDAGSLWRFWVSESSIVDLPVILQEGSCKGSALISRFPARYLSKHTPVSVLNSPFPPTFLIHGELDRVVTPVASETLGETLAAYGTHVRLQTVPEGNHLLTSLDETAQQELELEIIHFMTSFFRK